MTTKTRLENYSGFYFITFTCYKWMHLFQHLNFYSNIYHHLNTFIELGENISGFVLMPNHLHLLIYHREENGLPDTLIGNLKRFIAYDIVDELENRKDKDILLVLQNGLTSRDKAKKQKHRVFEDSFDIKRCYSEPFINQKLNYMHNNPVQPKWKLAEEPTDYLHSYARFYINGDMNNYSLPLMHWQKLRWIEEDK